MRISIFAYIHKMNISCMHMQLRCIFSKSVVSKFHRVYYKGCIYIVQCVVSMFLRLHQNRIYFTVCGFNVSYSTLELYLFYSMWFQCFIEYTRIVSISQYVVSMFHRVHQNCIYFIVFGFNVSQSTLELYLFYFVWFHCF